MFNAPASVSLSHQHATRDPINMIYKVTECVINKDPKHELEQILFADDMTKNIRQKCMDIVLPFIGYTGDLALLNRMIADCVDKVYVGTEAMYRGECYSTHALNCMITNACRQGHLGVVITLIAIERERYSLSIDSILRENVLLIVMSDRAPFIDYFLATKVLRHRDIYDNNIIPLAIKYGSVGVLNTLLNSIYIRISVSDFNPCWKFDASLVIDQCELSEGSIVAFRWLASKYPAYRDKIAHVASIHRPRYQECDRITLYNKYVSRVVKFSDVASFILHNI